MESKRLGDGSVRISFTREEIAPVLKAADDRRDYGKRTGMYWAGRVTVLGEQLTQEQGAWLALRKGAAAELDPETAEVTFTWGDICDPYELWVDDKDGTAGRNYYARSPGGVWVAFDDLPEAVCARLQKRLDAREVIDAYRIYRWERDGTTREEQIERWLVARREEGARIDPEVAEVTFRSGQSLDPYGIYLKAEMPEEEWGRVVRHYFARSPGGEWISFDDLAKPTLDRLWARMKAGEVTDPYDRWG
jgi:hypothetical protein